MKIQAEFFKETGAVRFFYSYIERKCSELKKNLTNGDRLSAIKKKPTREVRTANREPRTGALHLYRVSRTMRYTEFHATIKKHSSGPQLLKLFHESSYTG